MKTNSTIPFLHYLVVELGCQDTNLVGGNDKEVLDGIIPRDGLILATLSMDKEKCAYLECLSGCFGVLRGSPGSQMVGYRLGRWK